MEDTIDPRWRKSTRSSGNGGACVEVGHAARAVLVRDTTDRDGGTLDKQAAQAAAHTGQDAEGGRGRGADVPMCDPTTDVRHISAT